MVWRLVVGICGLVAAVLVLPITQVQASSDTPFEVKVFRDPLRDGGAGPEMVVIPQGRFRMGDIQGGGFSDEDPVHEVAIQRVFALGRNEITFDEYDRFASETNRLLPADGGWGRGTRPVIEVSWQNAVAYAKWLSDLTGKRYRLPTEVEWEYAARAGSETAYWWGNKIGNNRANCNGCGSRWDDKQTAPTGTFPPNAFGLYDTVGNVWEWVQDCWHSGYQGAPTDGSAWQQVEGANCDGRVVRGGSWSDDAALARSAFRYRLTPDYRVNLIGFRLARDL